MNAPSESPLQARRKPGTLRYFPTKFTVAGPTSTPTELFSTVSVGNTGNRRFVSQNSEKVLVYTDGACPNNGQEQARGGWAVVFGPGDGHGANTLQVVSGPLEERGPDGDMFSATTTNNRAELRAAIEALAVRDWKMEGFSSLVIATDSAYVVDGATQDNQAKKWTRNGWKNSRGGDVKNQDLWKQFLGEVEKCYDGGLLVELWHIPRELNEDADAAAKTAASGVPGHVRSPDARPRVLALCLDPEAEDIFDAVWKDYVSAINSKTRLERVTTPEAAFDLLDEPVPSSIVLVTDAALSRHKRLWERVIDHVRAGATVVIAGCFSTMVSRPDFQRFFAKLGLPWEIAEYCRLTVDLQPDAVGDSHLASRLPVAYSQKAVFITGADVASIWYAPSDKPTWAAVAFATVGNGKVGYVGDVNGEEASAKVALAMCGLLD